MSERSDKKKMDRSTLRKSIWLPLLFLCMAFCLFGCASSGRSSSGNTAAAGSTLRVGVRSIISGFGYLNENTGKYSGLEVDIATEMADRMGYGSVEFITVTPETRVYMLSSGEVDCVLACYSITDAQKEVVDFSPAYYEDSSIIMVENTSLFKSVEDIMGHGYTFGTVEGTNTASELVERLKELGLTDGVLLGRSEDGLTDHYDNFDIAYFETYRTMNDLLEGGSIDAFCADGCIARTFMEDDRNILDFTISTQEYGAATLKDSALSAPVAEAIRSMLDDGTIAELIDKWD